MIFFLAKVIEFARYRELPLYGPLRSAPNHCVPSLVTVCIDIVQEVLGRAYRQKPYIVVEIQIIILREIPHDIRDIRILFERSIGIRL
jgi:hypothetical protein